ncbi:unnamed protein product [Polarella glacialis]|uniref:Uncharacterized protein n=1 Tax=Polarella glacialis TaxID=89957 RepID=A0A813K3N9_POLGL|nr:unnamed protein product [Polarella glacialis]CAE8691714.1 unnamed protein product [Polarella glacialis]
MSVFRLVCTTRCFAQTAGRRAAQRFALPRRAASSDSTTPPQEAAAPTASLGSNAVVYMNPWMQELDDLPEEEDEKLLPPWKQRKPWRWESAEEKTWLPTLPKVQEDKETGRSAIVGFGSIGIVVFFSFVWWGPPQAREFLRFGSRGKPRELNGIS